MHVFHERKMEERRMMGSLLGRCRYEVAADAVCALQQWGSNERRAARCLYGFGISLRAGLLSIDLTYLVLF